MTPSVETKATAPALPTSLDDSQSAMDAQHGVVAKLKAEMEAGQVLLDRLINNHHRLVKAEAQETAYKNAQAVKAKADAAVAPAPVPTSW